LLARALTEPAAKRFFRKALQDQPLLSPDRIGTDGAGAYPPAIAESRKAGLLARTPVHYITKHLQQGIESDHFRVKRPMPRVGCFQAFHTARRTIQGFEMLWADGGEMAPSSLEATPMERPMPQQLDDLSRSLTPLEQDSTIVAVIEMSQASWLVAGIVPGIERHPLKKLEPSEVELLRLLMRWRAEATQNGRTITRIAVAFEAGRDGFWLARWLRARGIEAYVIHPASVAVSREHRRAKTDRLDTGLLKRVFLGWLRGEPDHCHMVAIPTLAEEDAKRPNREREGLVRERTRLVNRMKSCLVRFGVRTFKPTLRNAPDRLATLRTPEGVPLPPNTLLELRRDMARLRFVMDQIKEVEEARAQGLNQVPPDKTHVMVRLLARVIGIGLETADMLVQEVLARTWRDRRAVARYAGLTGSPDESGSRRREKGLAKAGNARVRRGMIQLAWRFLLFQKESALAQWYRARTADARGSTRKTLIVALARKLLITGEVPAGVVLRAA
jgi:transposase